MCRRLTFVLVTVVALAMPAVASATPPAALSTDPMPVTCGHLTSVNLFLDHDMTCALFAQMSFPFQHYTLDLRGHTLSGFSAPPFVGEIASVDVRNGTLFRAGLDDHGGRMENLHIVESTIGVSGGALTGSHVESSIVTIWASRSEVTHNTIRGGSGVGIDDINRGISDYQISWNDISASTTAGLHYCVPAQFWGEVSGSMAANHIHDNAGPGIQLCRDVENLAKNVIAFNVIDHNAGAGIQLDPSTAARNPVTPPSGPIQIGANLLIANQGAGVDATWIPGLPNQIVDLGSDIALFNQKRCVGVRCSLDFTSGHGLGA
jgi:hypothetical protein